ncbi:MAG TPA: hypothetical protein VKV15_28660 [Bryobacteraceae bacterium]|nr:hypothetical protein [Bryobacteraceae bacterium]
MLLGRYFLGAIAVTAMAGAPVMAQSLAEHSAAAVGGSAAGVAGPKVSDSLNRIMGRRVSPLVQQAAQTGSITVARPVTKAMTATRVSTTPPAAATRGGGVHPKSAQDAAASSLESETRPPRSVVRALPKGPYHPRIIPALVPAASQNARVPVLIQPAVTPPAPPPVPTTADLQSIKPGLSRRDVVAKLGLPTDKIAMPDDEGHLSEVMHYSARGTDLGTVRMSDGLVTDVSAGN